MRGRDVQCRSCNAQVDQLAAKILSGEELEKRAAKLQEQEKLTSARRQRVQLEADRRAYVEANYIVGQDSEEYLLDQASLFARVGVLSTIYGTGDRGGMIIGINLLDDSIGPSDQLSRDLFVAAWSAQLLQIHPSTPTDALVWDEGSAIGTGSIYPGQSALLRGRQRGAAGAAQGHG
jgi:hypothetical protein